MEPKRLAFLITFIYCFQVFSQNDKRPEIQLFSPNTISTDSVEFCPSFSSSGKEVYFARSGQNWGTSDMKSAIYQSTKKGGQWSVPKLLPFSGQFDDSDPCISDDGNTLYFISKRPFKDHTISADIWVVHRNTNGNWGTPIRLEEPVNSPDQEYGPRTDTKGNLYFASDREGGYGQGDLYICNLENGALKAPMNMGSTINSDQGEWNLEINASGNLLIFEASGRKENQSSYGDLYISFKSGNLWSIPQNIQELNTTGSDLYPQLTDNGNRLFFTSSDSLSSRTTNIYSVAFRDILNSYKRKAVFPK